MRICFRRLLTVALALFVCLAAAGAAQAYAIYNHVGHEVCVSDRWNAIDFKDCSFKIPAHGTHNGGHGDSLSHVQVFFKTHDTCHASRGSFDIPHGGYARIYDNKVKVYKHDGKHVETRGFNKYSCGD